MPSMQINDFSQKRNQKKIELVARPENNEGVVYTDAQQQEGGGKVQRDELDPNVTTKSKAGNLKEKQRFRF